MFGLPNLSLASETNPVSSAASNAETIFNFSSPGSTYGASNAGASSAPALSGTDAGTVAPAASTSGSLLTYGLIAAGLALVAWLALK